MDKKEIKKLIKSFGRFPIAKPTKYFKPKKGKGSYKRLSSNERKRFYQIDYN